MAQAGIQPDSHDTGLAPRRHGGVGGWEGLAVAGRAILAAALLGLGVENVVCARQATFLAQGHPPRLPVIPVLPWLPPVPALGWILGGLLALCGGGLLAARWRRLAAGTAAWLLLAAALAFDLPRYAGLAGSMGLRTLLFEPLAIACAAALVAGPAARGLERAWRALLALALVVFGADHIIALLPGNVARPVFTNVMPHWLPWPVFWIAFFGVAFLAAAASLATTRLRPWGMAGLGLMFGTWVLTLHLPRVLGWYGNPHAIGSADEWSSLLIAVALWGGGWALCRLGDH